MKQIPNAFLFSHAVGRFNLEDEMKKLNDELIILSFELEKKASTGVIKSNTGGYQSDLLENSNEIIKKIKNIFFQAVTRFAETIYIKKPFNINFDSPWLNINRENHFNKSHVHPGSDFSLTYYCEVPSNSGSIVFENPVLHQKTTMIWYEKHDMWNSEFVHIKPNKYDLIIFPSYLSHFVELNKSKKPRISLACNVQIRNDKDRRVNK
tara:strand:- start:1063 stop:1686 length:624 start_codon:yes stop_codon:yes gene_type:complete